MSGPWVGIRGKSSGVLRVRPPERRQKTGCPEALSVGPYPQPPPPTYTKYASYIIVSVTTIRLHQGTKTQLDRWRGRLIEAEGAALTAEETILRLLELADRHEADLLGQRIQATAEQVEEWFRIMNEGIRDWGVDSDAAHLDRDLYGA